DDPATRARRVYHMGNLLQKRGEVKDAAKMYRSAVKLDPTHKASHYNLGGFYLVGQDSARAAVAARLSLTLLTVCITIQQYSGYLGLR
ncbi:unnamed protein product, partial [Laminaria digitata]